MIARKKFRILLEELQEHCGGERPLLVARELTKRHEEQIGATVSQALMHFRNKRPQGEFTVVLGGASTPERSVPDDSELRERLRQLQSDGMSASQAARQLAEDSGISKRQLYSLLHQTTAD